jgi:uncharacterized protein (DUF305 family)
MGTRLIYRAATATRHLRRPGGRLAFRRRTVALVAVTTAGALLVSGYAVGAHRAAPRLPDDASVEAGFARDMSVHHSQAVTLAMLAYARATLPAVRDLADDIVLNQQRELGVMTGWLQQWHLSESTTRPAMAWMRHQVTPPADPPMPGMATRREVSQFIVTRGVEVDQQFCRLMLRHHQGGLHMLHEVLQRSHRPEVLALATQMRADQQREIGLLQRLLTRLAAEAPTAPNASTPRPGTAVHSRPASSDSPAGDSLRVPT